MAKAKGIHAHPYFKLGKAVAKKAKSNWAFIDQVMLLIYCSRPLFLIG